MALTTYFRAASFALAAGLITAPAALAETPAPSAMQFAQTDEQQPGEQAVQPDEQQPAEQQPAEQVVQPDEEQLESFVVATLRIIDIQQQAQQQMAATEAPEEQEQLRNEALQRIVAAVEEQGLSVDEYNGIVKQVEADPELGQTVQQRIQEKAAQ